MKSVRLFEWGEGRLFFHQWGRLKRREKALGLLIYSIWFIHIVFWILWIFFIAPYTIALTIPLGVNLGFLAWLRDYLWPILNLLIVAINHWLIVKIYPRDILSSWLLLGATLFLQIIILGIAISLILIGI